MMNNLMFYSGGTTTGAIYAGNTGFTSSTINWDSYLSPPGYSAIYYPLRGYPPGRNKFIKEGTEMKGLYDVYLVYGEDREDIVLERAEGIVANDEEDAKIKSGLMKKVQDNWDSDYLTFIVRELGKVFVKEKPKEVKNI